MTRRFSRPGRKTMGLGGETKGCRINGVVARQDCSVYKQKQKFDEQPCSDEKKYIYTER